MTLTEATTTRTIELGRDRLLSLEAARGRIRVTHGCTWLTEPGSAGDVFLAAGDEWSLNGRPVVLGALGPARVELVGATAAEGALLRRGWRRVVSAARRQVQRLQLGPATPPP